MTRPIHVTEHALVRYLERGWGVDMKARRQIAMNATDSDQKINDHMLVEYLEQKLDFDVKTLRRRVARVATGIMDKNSGITNLTKAGEYLIKSNGLVFRFRAGKTRTTLITITGNRRNRGVLSNRALRIQNQYGQKNRRTR